MREKRGLASLSKLRRPLESHIIAILLTPKHPTRNYFIRLTTFDKSFRHPHQSVPFSKEMSRQVSLPSDPMARASSHGEFVDELIDLWALEEVSKDDPLLATCPLFCVPKPGQPGQWRVIANCREGGQNAAIGSDPVVLPRMNHILGQMYTGGWSAVVDASKMFYQFTTKEEEQKYLGLIHPITGKHYRYRGLPMGTGNSPAIANRISAGFVR